MMFAVVSTRNCWALNDNKRDPVNVITAMTTITNITSNNVKPLLRINLIMKHWLNAARNYYVDHHNQWPASTAALIPNYMSENNLKNPMDV